MMAEGIFRSGDYTIIVEGILDILAYHECMSCSVPILTSVEKDFDVEKDRIHLELILLYNSTYSLHIYQSEYLHITLPP